MLTATSAKQRNRHVSQRSSQSHPSLSSTSASSTVSTAATSLRSSARSSTSTVDSRPLSYEHFCGVGQTSLSEPRLQPSQPLVEGRTSPTTPACIYWCTGCEDPRPFTTYNGWTRHEKETHEGNIYICMPDGPTVNTQYGPACAICGERNPISAHMNMHNMLPCLQKAPSARTYNRCYQLETHLEDTHGVLKGSAVAKKWRAECFQQAWACGFCAAYFDDSSSRFNHIATEHYRRGENLSRWDPTKVVLGLLQQPKVHEAWTEHINLQFPNPTVELRWDRASADALIKLLERGVRGQEDGTALAMEAFIQLDCCRRRPLVPRPSNSVSTSSQAVPQESQIYLGAVTGSHWPRNSSDRSSTTEQFLPIAEDSRTRPRRPRDPTRQIPRVQGENPKPEASHIYPMAKTGSPLRSAAMASQPNDIFGVEANDTSFLSLDLPTDDFDLALHNFADPPVLEQPNFGSTNNDSTTLIPDMLINSSHDGSGAVPERYASPMDLSQYVDFGT